MGVRRFDSLYDFLNVASFVKGHPYDNRHRWDLGVSADVAKERALTGDVTITNQAAALIERIEPDIGDVALPCWVPSIGGSRVVVPEYLTGAPRHMRRRVRGETTGRCVDVFVDLSSSCGIDALDLVSRGCAIIALLETLQRINVSVNLSVGFGCRSGTERDGEIWGIIPIESRPLDVSSASFVIAHPAFCRNLLYRVLEKQNGCDLTWSKFGRGEKSYRLQAEYIGLKESDVFVPAADLYDKLIIDNPTKWVEERVRQCLRTSTEG